MRTSETPVHDKAGVDQEEERVKTDHGDEAQNNGREDDASVVKPETRYGERPRKKRKGRRSATYALPRKRTPVPTKLLRSMRTAWVTVASPCWPTLLDRFLDAPLTVEPLTSPAAALTVDLRTNGVLSSTKPPAWLGLGVMRPASSSKSRIVLSSYAPMSASSSSSASSSASSSISSRSSPPKCPARRGSR